MKANQKPLAQKRQHESHGSLAPATPVRASAKAPKLVEPPLNPSRPSIQLRIEELVLNGFQPAHRYRIGRAVEQELTRLIIEQGTPIEISQHVEIAQLDGGTMNVRSSSSPEATGINLAQVIYRGIKQ